MRKPRQTVFQIIGLLLLVIILSSLPSTTAVSSSKSLYDTLGVAKGCSSADLKKGYRKQCLQHHPDKGGSEAKFKEVTRAYDILSDDAKRKAYDQYGDAAMNENGDMSPPGGGFGGGAPGGGGSSFFSSFGGGGAPGSGGGGGAGGMPNFSSFNAESLFGSATSRNAGTGGLNIDLSELLRQMGAGESSGGGTTSSPFGVGGQQQQYTQSSPQKAPPKAYTRNCPCTLEELATGATKKMKVKFGQRSKVYTVSLQKGWKAGTKVKFNASKDGRFGPMTFVIQEKRHPLLERRGDDLVYRHDLSSSRRVNASANATDVPGLVKLELVLPDGEVWTRSLSKSSSFLRQGQTLTVTDKGMPIKGGPSRGNLIIEFFDSSASKTSGGGSNSQSDARAPKQETQTKSKQQPS